MPIVKLSSSDTISIHCKCLFTYCGGLRWLSLVEGLDSSLAPHSQTELLKDRIWCNFLEHKSKFHIRTCFWPVCSDSVSQLGNGCILWMQNWLWWNPDWHPFPDFFSFPSYLFPQPHSVLTCVYLSVSVCAASRYQEEYSMDSTNAQ